MIRIEEFHEKSFRIWYNSLRICMKNAIPVGSDWSVAGKNRFRFFRKQKGNVATFPLGEGGFHSREEGIR